MFCKSSKINDKSCNKIKTITDMHLTMYPTYLKAHVVGLATNNFNETEADL